MAIYLGDSGYVDLRREALNTSLTSELDANDVNVAKRRFSFDFDIGSIITGDQLEIATTDGSELELVVGHSGRDGKWYCNVDQAGGVRLYDSFTDALNGEIFQAKELRTPSATKPIVVKTGNLEYRCVAQVVSYQMTTSRESVSVDSLGDQFRTSYANGMISGQGTLSCLWDYEASVCEPNGEQRERPNYLAQLVLRTQQGASFLGRFFLKGQGRTAIEGQNDGSLEEALWWECRCIITNVATSFEASEPVSSSIEFVTTGPVALKMGAVAGYILKEPINPGLLLQETDEPLELED